MFDDILGKPAERVKRKIKRKETSELKLPDDEWGDIEPEFDETECDECNCDSDACGSCGGGYGITGCLTSTPTSPDN